jgi:His-Xaa-Ser repeat protein HxsA
MTNRRYIISSLAAAGITIPDLAQATLIKATTSPDRDESVLVKIFAQDHTVSLAGHGSHSSHSSHASHSSSTGGTYYPSPVYAPVYAPSAPPPPPPPPPSPPPSPSRLFTSPELGATPPSTNPTLPALPGRTKRFAAIVRRVQLALLAQGFYSGTIDGVVGPDLRGSLRQFQKSRSLKETGTITTQTLDALMVSSE